MTCVSKSTVKVMSFCSWGRYLPIKSVLMFFLEILSIGTNTMQTYKSIHVNKGLWEKNSIKILYDFLGKAMCRTVVFFLKDPPADFLKISAGSAARSSVNLWSRRILTIAITTVLRKLSQQMSCYGNFCNTAHVAEIFATEVLLHNVFATEVLLWKENSRLFLQHRSCCRTSL